MNNNPVIYKIMRRRERLRRQQEVKNFDSSSIGDMAFLLLIFFIVTSSFILRQGIFFSLPSKSAGSVRIEENRVIDVYPENSGFLYSEQLLGREEFSTAMMQRVKKNEESVMIIHMKEGVIYDRLVDTLSVARETGIRRVSLKNDGARAGMR